MKQFFALVLIVLACTVPLAVQADCGGDCVAKCAHLGSGPDYAACMNPCMDDCLANDPPAVPPVPAPTPVEPPTPSTGTTPSNP